MDRKLFAVLWIKTDPNWIRKLSGDLPDDFRVVSPLLDNVDWSAAQVVADAANSLEGRRRRGQWAAVFEQDWADQHLPTLK